MQLLFLALLSAVWARGALDDWCPAVRCVGRGAECGDVFPNASTYTVGSCRGETHCLQGRSSDRTGFCGYEPGLGSPCADDWSCHPYLSTLTAPSGMFCGQDHRCWAKGVNAGDACRAQNQCARWLYCDTRAGECRDSKVLHKGDKCDEESIVVLCDHGLQCVDGVCAELANMGERCNVNVSCVDELTCSEGRCVKWQSVPLGESCEMVAPWGEFVLRLSESCVPGLVCYPQGDRAVCMKPLDDPHKICDDPSVSCPDGTYCGCDFGTGTASCMPLLPVTTTRFQAFTAFRNCVHKARENMDLCMPEWLRWKSLDPLWSHDRGWAPIACQTPA